MPTWQTENGSFPLVSKWRLCVGGMRTKVSLFMARHVYAGRGGGCNRTISTVVALETGADVIVRNRARDMRRCIAVMGAVLHLILHITLKLAYILIPHNTYLYINNSDPFVTSLSMAEI